MSLTLTKLAYSIAAYPIKLYRLRDNSVQGKKVQREDNSEGSMQFERLRKAALIRYWEKYKTEMF